MHAPKLQTNTDALIGREGVVTQRVAAHQAGQVKLGDEVWRAEPADGGGPFESGAHVTVAGIRGVTLQVR
jgi:membrane protein implicated in regulation of membrane protease activity